MRFLKFKAWDSYNQRWLFPNHKIGDHLAGNGESLHVWLHYNKTMSVNGISEGCIEFCQFTGLLDKEGKEIYESDIIQVEENIGATTFKSKIIGSVEWGEYGDNEYVENLECWIFNGGHHKTPLSSMIKWNGVRYSRGLQTKPNTAEIIGNVFENKELLLGS